MAATNGNVAQEQYSAPAAAADAPTIEQIVWAFLEKFFEIMSKNPEKLYLFYNAKSQLVIGNEAEVAEVSAGRTSIQKRIQSLDFKDCKVRLTNVDCQSCGEDKIVSQVIGEMISSGSAEIKKFTQTFVLAPQPNGYYVLNDIFRYIVDEEEEIAEPVATEDAAAPAAEEVTEQESVPEPEAVEEDIPAIDAEVIAEKLKEDIEPAVLKPVEAEAEVQAPVEAEEEKPVEAEKVETPEVAEKEIEADALVPEAPQDPSPTPVVRKATPPKPAPVVPALPAKPMSWASRAAAAAAAVAAPRPAAPAVPTAKAAAPAQARAPAPAAAPAPKAAEPTSPASNKENDAPQTQGWQTAGADAKKQNRPQQSAPLEKEGTMAYIPNVNDKVTPEALRAVLGSFGNLTYVDINRQKNCAFVEYATPAGYQAAFAANPHKINEETIRVEPRRPKTAFSGAGNFGGRGGMNNRGRGGFENRGPGGQRGRGNFNGPARGGAPRGARGGPVGAPAAAPATSA